MRLGEVARKRLLGLHGSSLLYLLCLHEPLLDVLVLLGSVSLFLTPLCCDDIHDVTPRVSALAGCDTADGGNDGDDEDEPSEEDEDDDVDMEADEDEDEDEHPTPADSVVVALPVAD
ncbi:hypothetical protein Tco_0124323 [Tanacetum coccineum]